MAERELIDSGHGKAVGNVEAGDRARTIDVVGV
jgi:hypothetical protein